MSEIVRLGKAEIVASYQSDFKNISLKHVDEDLHKLGVELGP